MKIPRDISGAELIRKLKGLGYEQTRQAGSHIRLTTHLNGTHHITIPNHDPLKIGTLSAIVYEIAAHFGITKEQLLTKLF